MGLNRLLIMVVLAGSGLLTGHVWAANAIVRGPYLQQVSAVEITIRWRGTEAHIGTVHYGMSPSQLTQQVSGTQSRIDQAIRITGLTADTTYYYQINDGAVIMAGGDDLFFQTAPETGAGTHRRIWVMGDSGTADDNARAMRDAYITYNGDTYTDLLLMLGDNAYPVGTDSQYQQAAFDVFGGVLKQTPWFSCFGNHDGYTADSGTQTGPYYDILTLPKQGECGGVASGTEAYFSFDFGNIHFISLDSSDSELTTNGAMYGWLEQDLVANTSDWLITFFHHPPYTKGHHDSDDPIEDPLLTPMRENFLPLLESYGVDLVMSGHSHSYERSSFLNAHYGFSSTYIPGIHAVDAGDGSDVGDGGYEKAISGPYAGKGAVYLVAGSSGKLSEVGPDYPHVVMATALEEIGSVVLDVTDLRLDAVFLNMNGEVTDSFSITKVAVSDGDTDGDTIPDSWEQYFFKDPVAADADMDADADGMNNQAEYVAGTIPTDATSVFKWEEIRQTHQMFHVRWPSVEQRVYDIWSSTNLLSDHWIPVSSNLAATVPFNEESLSLSNSATFFRLDVRYP